MKNIFLALITLITFSCKAQQQNSKVITDHILGNPKFVKEYVIFLNNSGPFTFMKGDSEYGHSIMMTPRSLRASMKGTWFETDFCRYINNETYYDRNQKIVKETWFYKSGEIVDDHNYTYDILGRLVKESSKNRYSKDSLLFFYEGNKKEVKFEKSYYKWKNDPVKININNFESEKPLLITKFDTLSKTDSIFTVTNDIWRKVGERSYTRGKDSIYQKKLSRIKIYNNNYKVIEEKTFNYEDDHENKKIYLTEHTKYEYNEFGNLIKQSNIKDGKFYSYTMLGKGKIISEEKKANTGKTWYEMYVYDRDQRLERRTSYYDDKIQGDIRFEYKENYISKLHYLEIYDENKVAEPKIIIFKYKFDKHKNWTEVIKNVNGKDLYKWVREIKYY